MWSYKSCCSYVVLTLAAGFCGTGGAAAQEAAEPSSQPAEARQETVIVTAARREQSVLEVPSPILVLGGAALDQQGAENFQDYIATLPAVGFTDVGGGGSPRIGIRGVANVTGTEFGSSDSVETVGLYLGEVPISGSGSLPDLAIYDLNRVEVLKGPQGTLYGEGAMSGAIRLIPNGPNFQEFEAKAEASYGAITDGGGKHRIRGAVNIPLIQDRLALRLVGSQSHSDGFIDNVAQGIEDINSKDQYSLRAVLGAEISENVGLEFLYLKDRSEVDDFDDQSPALPERQQSLLEDRGAEQTFDLYALTLTADLGFAELVSASSYVEVDREIRPKFAFLGFPQEVLATQIGQETFTQEVRLVSSGDGPLEWAVGGFYRDRTQSVCGEFDVPGGAAALGATTIAARPCPISRSDFILYRNVPSETFEQTAVFADFTYGLTDRLRAEFGARWFDESFALTQDLVATGALAFLTNSSSVEAGTDDFLFKAGLNYDLTENSLLYAKFSQGFRSGGPNLNSALVPGSVPDLFEPDTLDNYEIGLKSSSPDGTFIFDGSVFFTKWNNIQISDAVIVSGNPFGFQSNQGGAEVYGIDSQFIFELSENLSAGVSLAYLHSELTEASATSGLVIGQPLTNAPEWSGSTFMEYRFQFPGGHDGFVRGDYSYTAEQFPDLRNGPGVGVLTGPAFRSLEARNLANLRAGVDFGRWGVDVFADNVFDEAVEYGLDDPSAGSSVIVGEPRVVGVTVRFEY